MHGRFHVRTNQGGQQIVTDHQDEPVKNVANLGRAASMASAEESDLPAASFKNAVRDKLQRKQ
jgi:hypothetical protein